MRRVKDKFRRLGRATNIEDEHASSRASSRDSRLQQQASQAAQPVGDGATVSEDAEAPQTPNPPDQPPAVESQVELPVPGMEEPPVTVSEDHEAAEQVEFGTLWDKAYEKLRLEESKLITAYENDTLALQGSTNVAETGIGRQERLQDLAQARLAALEDARLQIAVGRKQIVVRDQIHSVVKGIISCKDIISAAISSQPGAAAAWGGIIAVVPFIDGMFQQDEDASNGFEYITNLLIRYRLVEEDFLTSHPFLKAQSENRSKLVHSLEDKIITIYSQVFLCQIRLVRQYSCGTFFRSIRDLVVADDWKALLGEVKDKESQVDRDLQSLTGHTVESTERQVRELADKLGDLSVLQMTTLSEVENIRRDNLLEKLTLAEGAAFDSFEEERERRCLKDTQRHILGVIQQWVQNDEATTILWLSGMAGTGKSTLSRTAANALHYGIGLLDEGAIGGQFLGASFFFSQRHATRNNTKNLISTVARSLARAVPELKIYITDAISENSDVANRGLRSQWNDLIIEPLSKLDSRVISRIRLFIVIDALDECENHADISVLLLLFTQLSKLQHLQVRIMITGRPEPHIRLAFNNLPETSYQCEIVRKVQQSEFPDREKDDIMMFLAHELSRIRSTHSHPDGWPGSENIATLHRKADGLFIYASTACRFLDDPWGGSRLDAIFEDDVDGEAPQQSLDGIYSRILAFSVSGRSEREKSALSKLCRKMLGCIITVFTPVSVGALAKLSSTPDVEVNRILGALHSIVEAPVDLDSPVGIVHLSFRDFLLSPERCQQTPEFLVDEVQIHHDLAMESLELMSKHLRQDICGLRMPGSLAADVSSDTVREHIPSHVQYACRFWVDHLAQLVKCGRREEAGLADDSRVHKFLKQSFLYWLEALSLMGRAEASITTIDRLKLLVNAHESPKLAALIRDASRFVLRTRSIFESTPLQLYVSALIFCPERSIIRRLFRHLIPPWITKFPSVEDSWSSEIMMLEGHAHRVNGISFSPKGDTIISGSDDNTVRLWDVATGVELARFTHECPVLEMEYSPDGKTAAIILYGGDLVLQDLVTWEYKSLRHGIHMPDNARVPSAYPSSAFSPDGNRLAAFVGRSPEVWVYHLQTGEHMTQQITSPKDSNYLELAFSSDSEVLTMVSINRYDEAVVQHWTLSCNASEKGAVVVVRPTHPRDVSKVILSPGGDLVISLSSNYDALCVWDSFTGTIKMKLDAADRKFDSWIRRPAIFVPRKHMIATRHVTGTVSLWSLATGDIVSRHTFFRNQSFIPPFKISPDNTLLAAEYGSIIRIFDLILGNEELARSDDEEPDLSGDESKNELAPSGGTVLRLDSLGNFQELVVPKLNITRHRWRHEEDECPFIYVFDGWGLGVGRKHEFEAWGIFARDKLNKIDPEESLGYWIVSPDGNLVALGFLRKFVVAEMSSGVPRLTLEPKSVQHHEIFSPNSEAMLLVLGRSTRLYNLTIGVLVAEIPELDHQKVLFSPDSQLLCLGLEDRMELVYTSNGVRRLLRDADHLPATFHWLWKEGVVFSADSRFMATLEREGIRVWETAGATYVRQIPLISLHPLQFARMAISKQGTLAVLLPIKEFSPKESKCSKLHLWDVMSGQHKDSLELPHVKPEYLSFSEDESYLHTDIGRLPLPQSFLLTDHEGNATDKSHQSLWVSDTWVLQGLQRLVWLPRDYRVSALASGRTVVFSSSSSKKVFWYFHIDLDKTPRPK